jgi:hypothetical protein
VSHILKKLNVTTRTDIARESALRDQVLMTARGPRLG